MKFMSGFFYAGGEIFINAICEFYTYYSQTIQVIEHKLLPFIINYSLLLL